jgi:hypothetical protein
VEYTIQRTTIEDGGKYDFTYYYRGWCKIYDSTYYYRGWWNIRLNVLL